MKSPILLITCLIILTNGNLAQTVADIDGNLYHTVTIGTQVWLQENLIVTHYNNGDEIPNVSNNAAWLSLSTGGYCNYENNASYAPIYGRLYNWFAVNDNRGICPTGWHTATDSEWTVLTDLLGGETIAGGKLKEAGTLHWASPNTGATNEVGFTALGGGYRSNIATFIGFSGIGSWWCSTESSTTNAWARGIFNDAVNVDRGGYYEKMMGFSVRCVMDPSTGTGGKNGKDEILMYPNPTTGKLTIETGSAVGQPCTIEIVDIAGRIMVHFTTDENRINLTLEYYPPGIYTLKIASKSSIQVIKLLKSN